MPHWTDFLLDKRKVEFIYGEGLPALDKVSVHEILFDRDGPTVIFRIDLSEYPSSPPKKWIENKFNTVQIQLSCVGVKCSSLEGWSNTLLFANIDLSREGDLINFELNGDGLAVCIKSNFLDVVSISAYLMV